MSIRTIPSLCLDAFFSDLRKSLLKSKNYYLALKCQLIIFFMKRTLYTCVYIYSGHLKVCEILYLNYRNFQINLFKCISYGITFN